MNLALSHAYFHFSLALLVGVSALASGTAEAGGNVAAGAEKTRFCATCHGPDGNGTRMGAPRLAGRSEAQFIQSMHLFRAGLRLTHPMMYILTRNLTPQDVADMGAYYAAQKMRVDGAPPPADPSGKS